MSRSVQRGNSIIAAQSVSRSHTSDSRSTVYGGSALSMRSHGTGSGFAFFQSFCAVQMLQGGQSLLRIGFQSWILCVCRFFLVDRDRFGCPVIISWI